MSNIDITDLVGLVQVRPLAIGGGLVLALLYVLYLSALPKPLPGIPYDVKSSHRLLGDIPHFFALEKAGRRIMEFWADVARRQQSPITQYFAGPFTKPVVIISDFRETKDLLMRRAKLLDHGSLNTGLWFGAIPHHFVGMPSSDPRYAKSKSLSNDLMTPSFLHNVSRKRRYRKQYILTYFRSRSPPRIRRPSTSSDFGSSRRESPTNSRSLPWATSTSSLAISSVLLLWVSSTKKATQSSTTTA